MALGSPKMICFFLFFGYSCAFLKDLMFYVFGDIGFLGTVAQFRVGHTSERSRDSCAVSLACVDHLEVSPGPFKGGGSRRQRRRVQNRPGGLGRAQGDLRSWEGVLSSVRMCAQP